MRFITERNFCLLKYLVICLFHVIYSPTFGASVVLKIVRHRWLHYVASMGTVNPLTTVKAKVKIMLRPTVSRSVFLVVKPIRGPKTRFLFLSDS
jgi:hypothetical protein